MQDLANFNSDRTLRIQLKDSATFHKYLPGEAYTLLCSDPRLKGTKASVIHEAFYFMPFVIRHDI